MMTETRGLITEVAGIEPDVVPMLGGGPKSVRVSCTIGRDPFDIRISEDAAMRLAEHLLSFLEKQNVRIVRGP